MTDPRIRQLAHNLIHFSCGLQPGENVLIEATGEVQELTRAIVGLGQTLGFEITAEGIETVEQLEFLRSIGCNHGQGYLFGKPMPVAEFEDWIIRGQHGEGI